MGLRGCLKNFLAKAGQKKDLGIYCEQLTKLETARIPASGRTPTALTNENVEEVEEFILSQEENPGTHESQKKYWKNYWYITKLCHENMQTIPWFNCFSPDQSSRFE